MIEFWRVGTLSEPKLAAIEHVPTRASEVPVLPICGCKLDRACLTERPALKMGPPTLEGASLNGRASLNGASRTEGAGLNGWLSEHKILS